MSYSIDSAILSALQECSEARDDSTLSGSDNWKIRIRDAYQMVVDELQAIHNAAGDPDPIPELRNAISGLQIGIGYTWGAIEELEKGNTTAGRSLLWSAVSYCNDGMNRIVAALDLID